MNKNLNNEIYFEDESYIDYNDQNESSVTNDLKRNNIYEDEEEDSLSKNRVELHDVLFENFKDKIIEEVNEDETIKKDIAKINSITLEQAVKDYKKGVPEAFDFIYAHYEPILSRWGVRCNKQELAIELLHIVLLNAVNSFDSTMKAKFNTYFWTCAKHYINVNNVKNDAKKRQHYKNMMSLQQQRNFHDESSAELSSMISDDKYENSIKNKELKLSIRSLDKYLKPNEIKIILKLIDNYKLQEIGKSMGVTTAAICTTLKRLGKKKVASKKLREVLMNY